MNAKRSSTPKPPNSGKLDPAATRVFMRNEHGVVEEKKSFAVVQTLRTHLVPPPAPKPQNQSFAAGGTLILDKPLQQSAGRAQPSINELPASLAHTQHFAPEELLARRAQREQRLNVELERELGLLSEPEAVLVKPKRVSVGRVLRTALMLALLGGSAYLFSVPRSSAQAAGARPSASAVASASSSASASVQHPAASATAAAPSSVAEAEVNVDARVTLQRAAADIVAQGRYGEALVLYRKLAQREPGNKSYVEIVRILEERLKIR